MRSLLTLERVTSTPQRSQTRPLYLAPRLYFAAGAFPVAGGPEYALAEKAVPFGLKSAVIDCFGLFNLARGPFAYLFRRRKADLYGIKIV